MSAAFDATSYLLLWGFSLLINSVNTLLTTDLQKMFPFSVNDKKKAGHKSMQETTGM